MYKTIYLNIMSGQPVKTPADINKFRNEYMETLRLQEQINDMNLEANKTYLLTGQLPPQSQMQDTRTTAEKLKDVEMMKQSIANDLRPIAEPQFAYQIVNAVMNSPLNYDNSLLRFLAQRASSIAEILSKSYSFGIEGNANDLTLIVENIKNMYSEQQGKFQSTKSYFNTLSSNGSSSRILSVNDIDVIITQIQDIIKNMDILIQKNVNVGGIRGTRGIIQRVGTSLIELKEVLPTTNQIKLYLDDVENPAYNNPYPDNPAIGPQPDTRFNREDLEAFYKLMEKLPKYTEVIALINKIKRNLDTGSYDNIANGFERLENMFLPITSQINGPLLNQFRRIKNRQSMKEQDAMKLQETQTRNFIRQQNEEQKDASKAQKVYIVNPADDAVYVRNGNIPQQNNNNIPQQNIVNPQIAHNPNLAEGMALGALGVMGAYPYYNDFMGNNINDHPYYLNQTNQTLENDEELPSLIDISQPDNHQLSVSDTIINDDWYSNTYKLKNSNVDDVFSINGIEFDDRGLPIINFQAYGDNQIYDVPLNRVDNYFYVNNPIANQPMNLIGHGLKKRNMIKGKGISITDKPYNYLGFGINEINKSKLEKGILTLRRKNKSNYPDMPSRRVSSKFSNIVKSIVGGSMPKYEELNSLDEDEKIYLNKLVKKSNLEDRLSIPAPSKDQQEKDIHNFEIMKGQLMSGNDSIELVKKFKLLIRKLSKQGLLPKADVEELNEILLEIGY